MSIAPGRGNEERREGKRLKVRHFSLLGGNLEVSAPDARLIQPLCGLLDGLETQAAGEPAFRLEITRGTPAAIPAGAAVAYEGPVNDEGECVLAEHDGKLCLLFRDRVSAVLDRAGTHGRIVVAAGQERRVAWTAGMMMVQAAVDRTGQFMVHAAGLSLPDRRGVVLISAKSGTGKTTTSLALADQGFGLCSDDAMVVDAGATPATAWGLPRDLKVHRQTAGLMPWLDEFLGAKWSSEGEQAVTRESLSRRIRIEPARHLPVAALFVLGRGDARHSEVARISQTDALVALAADNVRVGRTGLLAVHKRQFASLARLVSGVPVLRLTVGTDIGGIGAALIDALASQMTAAASGTPGEERQA